MTDILALPEGQGNLISWMMRSGQVDLDQVTEYLGQEPKQARAYLAPLIEQGFVRTLNIDTRPHYEVRMAGTRSRHLSRELAELAADVPLATHASAAATQKLRRQPAFLNRALDLLLGERGRFLLGLGPLVVIFLAAQGLLLTGRESFSEPLSFVGVVVVAMLAGIFPVLLVRAGRCRGDIVPEVVYHVIGHPIFLIIIFLLSLTGVILHGLFIWEDPPMRILALVVAAVIIGMTFNAWRQGAFAPRFIAELRDNAPINGPASLRLTYNGAPIEMEMHLVSADGDLRQIRAASHEISELAALQSVTVHLPAARAGEIKVLTYQVTPEGNSHPLPVLAELDSETLSRQVNLMETGGRVVLQLDDRAGQLTLTLLEKI